MLKLVPDNSFQPPAETSDSTAAKDGVNRARGHSCREIGEGGGRERKTVRVQTGGRRVRGHSDLRQWGTVSQELETHRPQTALAKKGDAFMHELIFIRSKMDEIKRKKKKKRSRRGAAGRLN